MKLMMQQGFSRHPKILRLASRLGVTRPAALGYLVSIWDWTMGYREAGCLSGLDDREIATAAGWGGKPVKFLEALISVGLIDKTDEGLQVHNWLEHQGPIMEKRARDRERQRALRVAARSERDRKDVATPVPFLSVPSLANPFPSVPGDGDSLARSDPERTTDDEPKPASTSPAVPGPPAKPVPPAIVPRDPTCTRCHGSGFDQKIKLPCRCPIGRARAKFHAEEAQAEARAGLERSQRAPPNPAILGALGLAAPSPGERVSPSVWLQTASEAEVRNVLAALLVQDPALERFTATRSPREVLRLCSSRLNGLIAGHHNGSPKPGSEP